MRKISCDLCPNSSCLIKKNFVQEWGYFIEQSKYQAFYRKDYSIIGVGNRISGLYLVQHGLVKEFIIRPHNNAEIVRFANEGKIFGHSESDSNSHFFGADAKIDSVICFFENTALEKMYKENQKLLYDLMLFHSNEHNESLCRLMNLSQMNLREKIASVLFYLYDNFGVNSDNELHEYFNRDDIASLACTTSEQVSRQLTDFQKELLIEKRARKIAILQPYTLKDIVKDYSIFKKI